LDHEVSARKHVQIVNATPGHLPIDLAIAADDGELVVALSDEPMLG
jgi:hypothetical protein